MLGAQHNTANFTVACKPLALPIQALIDGMISIASAGGVSSLNQSKQNYDKATSDPGLPAQGKPTPLINDIIDQTPGVAGQLWSAFADSAGGNAQTLKLPESVTPTIWGQGNTIQGKGGEAYIGRTQPGTTSSRRSITLTALCTGQAARLPPR